MSASRRSRGFLSPPSCPRIFHQMFTMKYSRASSAKFWASTCCGVTSPNGTENPHPAREEGGGGVADIDLKSVPDMLLYFLNKFGWGALPPENCLTRCHLFNFVSRHISSNVAYLNFKQWRRSSLHPDLLQDSEPIYLATSFTDLFPGYGSRLSTFTVI